MSRGEVLFRLLETTAVALVAGAASVLAVGIAIGLRLGRPKGGRFDAGETLAPTLPPVETLSADVLANVSHEIRTPLNGILGLTQLLLETHLENQQREYLEMIKSSGGTLLRALNDILDFSSIQAGKLSLESEAFHTRRWVRQCIKTLAPQAHVKGIELAYRVHPDVPTLVASDPTRLRQVLVNLAVNAIKYTNEGHVVVEVDFQRALGGSEGAKLRISVSDTGVGIAPSLQKDVFRAFIQGEAGLPGESGLGLGLAISSEIVDRMGGRIEVESEPGRGSVFRFEVPARAMDGSDDERESAFVLEAVSALVVDDSRVQREILAELLENWGVEVTLADDEASALEAAAGPDSRAFTLALIDSRMPGTDALALAARIQKRRPLKCVLMTLSHEQVSPEALKTHGFLGQLTKPIAPVHLMRAIEIIRRGVSVERSSDVHSYTMDRLVLGGLRLLVAEDNPVNRTVLLHTLERNGCDVELADNGRDALRLATEGSFDALLLDISMPELDGLSVCREIRKREASSGSHLAIVATTAHARGEDRERCLSVGMDAFVSKPYEEKELVAALDRALRRSGSTRAGVFDRAKALEHAHGDEDLLKELITLFLDEHPKTVATLADELTARRFAAAERLAHRLKGALLTLGARSSAKRADELEAGLREGNEDACRAAMRKLSTEVDDLLPLLRANLVSRDKPSVPTEPGDVPGSEPRLSDRRSR